VPVGPHITDFVSFPLRLVLDLVPDQESAEAQRNRADKRAWLDERGYRVIALCAADALHDPAAVLERLATMIEAAQ